MGCVQTPNEGLNESISDTTSSSPLEFIRDWKMLTVTVTLLSVLIVAAAFMVGEGFHMPELKAFAKTELEQIVVTALLLLCFVAFITFIDTLLATTVNGANLTFRCEVGQNCIEKTSNAYFDSLIEVTNSSLKESFDNAAHSSLSASKRLGTAATSLILPVPLLQASVSGATSAGAILDVERYGVVIQHLSGIYSIISSQRFFVSVLGLRIGSIFLGLGILLRSFFATRKLGGLLIALGIAIVFVLPMTYIFNWFTLSLVTYGDQSYGPVLDTCPVECSASPPMAYAQRDGEFVTFSNENQILALFGPRPSQEIFDSVEELSAGKIRSVRLDGDSPASEGISEVISCNFESRVDIKSGPEENIQYCPVQCRVRPYPGTEECTKPAVEQACNQIPSVCTKVRLADVLGSVEDLAVHGAAAFGAAGLDPSAEGICPSQSNGAEQVCPTQCRVTLPLKKDCTWLEGKRNYGCVNSPHYCRVRSKDADGIVGGLPEDCGSAKSCPFPEDASDPGASEESCVYIIPEPAVLDTVACKACLFVPSYCTYSPPTYVEGCAGVCNSAEGGAVRPNAAAFARKSADNLYGREEIKTVASLLLPAYVLPLFDILVAIMFVRTFSPILGGDIELPGMVKFL